MSDNEPILECPHCGSIEAPRIFSVEARVYLLGDTALHQVQCKGEFGGCGASGPFWPHESHAIEDWNLRASPWRPIKEYDKETAELVDLWVTGPDRPHSIPRCYWNFVHQAWIPLGAIGALKLEDCPNPTHFMRLPDGPRTAK